MTLPAMGDASTSVAPPSADLQAARRQAAKALMRDQEGMEEEISGITGRLAALPCGVAGPLVDAEGFPRSDVDVHMVLIERHRLAGERRSAEVAVCKRPGGWPPHATSPGLPALTRVP